MNCVGNRKPLRLLVIDDDRDVADSLALLIDGFGVEVRVAYDGQSGVEAAIEFQPDLALIDIRMPRVDGYETARRLRERLGARAPRLIALSGFGQDKDGERARAAGFDMHLLKPVPLDRLESLLRLEDAPRASTLPTPPDGR